jgi:hypothetical protein
MDGSEGTPGAEGRGVPLKLCITVEDQEVVAELRRHPDGLARETYALAALRIGILTLKQAQGRIDSELVANATNRLRETVESTLKEYFNPVDGKFTDRVDRLMKKDGELEQLMRSQIGSKDSQLAQTLRTFIGEGSEFVELLSPDESKGFLKALAAAIKKRLDEQRDRLLEQFSLDKEDSALSRLVKRVNESRDEITSEFSLDNEASALFRMRRDLVKVLDDETKKNGDFRANVLADLARITTSRDEAKRSTIHGIVFEDAVCQFVQAESQRLNDVAVRKGTIVGVVKNCKVGDCVIELGSDSRAAGAKIVIEAKEKASYTVEDARKEIDQGRKNRQAKVGLFVFSRKTAPAGLAPMQRFGDDVFVVWDAEDLSSDVYLSGGLSVARALCTREEIGRESAEVDFGRLDSSIANIEKQVKGLDEIKKSAETIETGSQNILDRVKIMRRELTRLIDELRDEVGGIKTHLLVNSEE